MSRPRGVPLALDYDPATTETVERPIRFPVDLYEALKARAAADNRTVSQTLRTAVRSYLEVPT